MNNEIISSITGGELIFAVYYSNGRLCTTKLTVWKKRKGPTPISRVEPNIINHIPKNPFANNAAHTAPTKGAMPGTSNPYCQSLSVLF